MKSTLGNRFAGMAAIGLSAVITLSGCTPANASTSTGKVNTAKVERGDLVLGLASDGKVALPITNLNFEVEGIVKTIYVSVGDYVKTGDILAELDDSEYQYAISSAENNLNKAQAAYDSAVGQYEYDLQRAENELTSLRENIVSGFDSYTYENAIIDAQTTLDRKREDLAKAEQKAASPFDPYTYDNAISDAEKTLAARLKDLETAEAALTAEFDDYSYQNSIRDAQLNVERKKKDYDSTRNSDASAAQIKSARESYEDAIRNLERSQVELERAREQHAETVYTQYENALAAVESAELALEKSKADRNRAQEQAVSDATEQLANAVQAVADAEASLERAQNNMTRAMEDFNDQLKDTRNSYDLASINADMTKNANASVSNAAFALEEAKLSLEEARQNLEKVKIYATKDGQILNITLSEGERATAQNAQPNMFFGTGNSSNSFMTLCDPTEIYLTTSITEGDIVGVNTGQVIRVQIDAIGDEVFFGKVTIISNIPSTDSNGITTYEVTCRLDETSEIIRDGMNAYITFVKKELPDVLLVPNKSVFIEEGMQYVHVVLEDGSYEKRKVICGLSNGAYSEVSQGLEAGETVVVGKVG